MLNILCLFNFMFSSLLLIQNKLATASENGYPLDKLQIFEEIPLNDTSFGRSLQAYGYGSSGESVRLLEYYRMIRRESYCNPETNVYPCGALEFLGCSGNKKFYSQSSIRLNWFEAWEFCRANGMHLASIQSDYEQMFIELFLPKPETGATEGYWTGGTDFGREGQFYWMSSGHSFTFSKWNRGEPNNFAGREHCVQVKLMMTKNQPNQGPMMWNDMPCTLVAYPLCQEDYSRPGS